MKAIVLAAGIGSRLHPITLSKPKTLVQVNGKPILSHIIDALLQNNIHDIIICVGFQSDQVRSFNKKNYPDQDFTYVENKNFDTTNNMYSLYLAKNHLTDDIILLNADLVFDSNVIRDIKNVETSCVAVDKGAYNKESMKITVNENGVINKISKEILPIVSYGSSIDVYKIIKNDLKIIKEELIRIIEEEKNTNQWTEVLLDNLFVKNSIKFYPHNIKEKWFEIDNFEDLIDAEILFNQKLKKLNKKKIFFIDKDGTLSIGNKPLDGSFDFLQALKMQDKLFYLISNNSSKTPSEHLKTFTKSGFDISIDNILVSIDATILFLKEKKIKNIFWIANQSVSRYLSNQGFLYDEENPSAILLTYDTEITYEKLRKLSSFVRKNIFYCATHSDIVCPTMEGNIPDIGTFIKLIEMTSGRLPDRIFGKPDKSFIDLILKKYNLQYDDAVIIGDRLYTDIKLAENSQITSILVLSGETSRQNYEESNIKADIIVRRIKDLINYI